MILRIIQICLIALASVILVDMFLLDGKIKDMFFAFANTSNYSPFHTDGQSNYILLFFILTTIGIIYVIMEWGYKKEKERQKQLRDKNEEESDEDRKL